MHSRMELVLLSPAYTALTLEHHTRVVHESSTVYICCRHCITDCPDSLNLPDIEQLLGALHYRFHVGCCACGWWTKCNCGAGVLMSELASSSSRSSMIHFASLCGPVPCRSVVFMGIDPRHCGALVLRHCHLPN